MPEPREQELERRIREALRQIIEKTDRKYDLRLSDQEQAERLRKAEQVFLDGGIEIAGELKTPLISASVKIKVERNIPTIKLALVLVFRLAAIGVIVGAINVLTGGGGATLK